MRPQTEFSDLVTRALIAKKSYRTIQSMVAQEGGKVGLPVLARHRKHIRIVEIADEPETPEELTAPPQMVDILQAIIQKGFANRKNWRPTIGDTMKAMEFWFKITQGNPFDELLNALAAATTGDDTKQENTSALGTLDETGTEDEDDA